MWLQVFDRLLNGDVDPYPSFFQNATGCTNYFNYMTCQVLEHPPCLCWVASVIHSHLSSVLATGARRPGLLLRVRDSAGSATRRPRGKPDVPRRLGGGEASSAGCDEEHQTVAGCADGQLPGEGWRVTPRTSHNIDPSLEVLRPLRC